MSRKNVGIMMGAGLLIILLALPAGAATAYWSDWNVAGDCTAVQTNSGRDKWVRDNTSKANWTATSTTPEGALHFGSLVQPTAFKEEHQVSYRVDVPSVHIAPTPWAKAKVTVAGVPTGEKVDVELRVRVVHSGASDSRRLESHWALGNGTYILTMSLGDTTFYHDDFTGQAFVLADELVARIFLKLNVTKVANWDVDWATRCGLITMDLDWIGLTDDPYYPLASPGAGGTITTDPAAASITMGDPLTLTAPAGDVSNLSYLWFKDGHQFANQPYPWYDRDDTWTGTPPDFTWTITGSFSRSPVLSSVSPEDAGTTYSCVYSSASGLLQTAPLTLAEEGGGGEITCNQNAGWIEAGTVLILTAPSGSDYQWFKNGDAVSNSSHVSGANEQVLTFSPLAVGDAGTYTCVFDDGTGKGLVQTAPYELSVLAAGTLPVAGIAGMAMAAAALGVVAARRMRRH